MPRKRCTPPLRQRAFTLLEALVALTIVAVALAAAARAAQVGVRSTENLRAALLIGWTAENQLAELRARRAWPSPGVTTGTLDMAGEPLAWRRSVEDTASRQFRRIEIRVWRRGPAAQTTDSPDSESTDAADAYRLVAFLMRPA